MPSYSSYNDLVQSFSPSYYFKLDNTSWPVVNTGSISATISQGSGYGSFTANQTGIVSKCVLSNSSQKLSYFNTTESTSLFTNNWTFSAWVKFNGNGGGRLLGLNNGLTGNNLRLFSIYATLTNSTSLILGYQYNVGNSGNMGASYSTTISQNTWYHVAIVANSSSTTFYVNGTSIGSNASGGLINTDFNNLAKGWLGYETTLLSSFNNGYVDEISVFPSALTSTNITDLYKWPISAWIFPTALTATALMPNPAFSGGIAYNVTPMTASASFPEAAWSEFDILNTLDGVLSGLDLELYLKFDDPNQIHNSGTAPDQIWQTSGTLAQIGPNGTYALNAGGTPTSTLSTPPGVGDGDFSMGVWVKFDEYMTDDLQRLMFIPQTYIGDSNGTLIGAVNKHPYFKMDTGDETHEFEATTINLEDGEWHYLAMRSDATNLYYYVDGEEVASGEIIGTPTFGYNLWFSNFPWEGQQSYEILSSPYIAEFSSVTETDVANIWAAGQGLVQGQTTLITPNVKFNNAYNDFVEYTGASYDLRFDEAGFLKNWGTYQSLTGIQDYISTGTVKEVPTKNRYGYEFLSAYDTWISEYSGLTGLTGGSTHSIYAKFDTTGEGIDSLNFPYMSALGGENGGYGSVVIGYDNSGPKFGVLEGESYNFYDPSTWNVYSTNDDSYMDSWHLYTVVLNGGYAYCYIDGAEVASFEVTSTHPDNGNIVVNAKSWYGDYNELNTFTIDEMQMWPGAAGPQDVFELWRSLTIDQDWVLSAEMPTPVGIPGSGVNYIDGAMIASASMPNPVHSHGSNLSDGYMTAFGTFMHPNFAAYKNVNFTQTSWTASATFENVTWQVGEYNGAEHMDAYAEMPAAYARIPGIWNAAPWIANATMVNPENIITTKGALIKPQSLNAIAFMVIPPAYYLLTDSLWFTRLYDAYKGNLARFAVGGTTSNDYVTHPSFIKFFNDTSDISVGDIVASQGFYENNATAIGSNITITPKITTGYTDAQNRRAVRLQNISLAFGNGTGSTAGGTTDRGYTLETMIKTTKATQNLFGGSWTSTNVNTNRQSMIGLNNGYLYAMQAYTDGSQVISARDVAKLSSPTLYQATKTNVADGNWHHIVIQMGYDGRLQIWIDGQLELQKYTGSFPYPNIIGQNAYDNTLSTDIYISAIAMNPQYFLTYKNLELNYYAAIDYVPVSAGVMTATATSVDAKARGNRGRALMLYFWSTRGLGNDPIGNSYYKGTSEGLDISLQRNTPYDQGLGGYFDGDTWFKLSTWEGVGREFYDWDIFPVDVQGYYTSPIVNQDSYKNQRTIGYYSGQSPYYYNISDGFVDELDNRRYIDLVNDIDLSDFDMICFRNYPDQQLELESFFRNESVDEYFGTIERELFEKFLTSLRGAVDTGMSLYISNAQLAVDMGIIDRIESVSDLDDNNTVREEIGGGTGDPYSLARVQEIGYQGDVGGLVNGFFYDRYKNNKHRVINTVTGLTDEPGYISTEQAYWEAIDAREFANPNRAWNHIEYRPNGLVIGDEFIWYPNSYVQAVPLANIKAGKAVTTFSSSYRRGTVLTDNPYNTYATTIVVEPGDVLNGKQVAGKIFVNFTELPEVEDERNTIELKSDYWLDIAKADGTIDETTYNQYKNSQTYNVDRKLEANLIDQDEYDYEKYWSMNGWNVIASAVEYPGSPTKLTVYSNSSGVRTKTKAITSKGRKKGVDTGTGGGTAPVFLVEWGFLNPVIDVRTLSMISRGLIWLSERANYSGIINRPLAVTAEATMVDPTVVADKDLTVNVQSMLASATINEVKNNIPNRNIVSLPMTATALINGFTKPYFATPGTVTAYMPQNVIASSFDTDQIVLYVMHTDPILYVREDVIK